MFKISSTDYRYILLLLCLISNTANSGSKTKCEELLLSKENLKLIEYISKYYEMPLSKHDFIDAGNMGCFGGEISGEGGLGKYGFYIWENESIYVGEFQINLPNGKGAFEHPGGWRYQGSWSNGHPVKGICSLKGVERGCETEGKYNSLWKDYQPISVEVIDDQYFQPFELFLRKDNPLSRGAVMSDWVMKSKQWSSVSPDGERTPKELDSVFAINNRTLIHMYRAHFGESRSGKEVILTLDIKSSGNVEACTVKASAFNDPVFEKRLCESVSLFYFGKKSLEKTQTLDYGVYFK